MNPTEQIICQLMVAAVLFKYTSIYNILQLQTTLLQSQFANCNQRLLARGKT